MRHEQPLAEPMQWRDQRQRQARPAAPEASGLALMHTAPQSSAAPEPLRADQIKKSSGEERCYDPGIERPRKTKSVGRAGLMHKLLCGM